MLNNMNDFHHSNNNSSLNNSSKDPHFFSFANNQRSSERDHIRFTHNSSMLISKLTSPDTKLTSNINLSSARGVDKLMMDNYLKINRSILSNENSTDMYNSKISD